MIKHLKKKRFYNAPTPMAGLALGLASIFWCWENIANTGGILQGIGALIATTLLSILIVKFTLHPKLLLEDIRHPVIGSVVPTFAMALMVISNTIVKINPTVGDVLWVFAVILHIAFLIAFAHFRARKFDLQHLIPSWFVPPVGLIVADVSFGGNPALQPIALFCVIFGISAYAIMLPWMLYRFIFSTEIPDNAKPTIGILAAPASLSLAGYLTVVTPVSPVIVSLLFGIAILMTALLYMSFYRLLKLDFSPGFAAFTFPLAIGATALFKLVDFSESVGIPEVYVQEVRIIAFIELIIATIVIGYVSMKYFHNYILESHTPSEK